MAVILRQAISRQQWQYRRHSAIRYCHDQKLSRLWCSTASRCSSSASSARSSASTDRPTACPTSTSRSAAWRPGKPVRTSVGASLIPDHGLDALVGADLVDDSGHRGSWTTRRRLLTRMRAAADAGSIILTVCSGAFVAGAAGLLDGRACTTHWMHADSWPGCIPTARVDRNVLFVDDGNLITSAGTAAGIDACLHLVRREFGSAVTNIIARRMVVPPQRDGGQRQYIDQPIPVRCSEGFAPQLDWILTNLGPAAYRGDAWPTGRTCRPALSPAGSWRRPARTPMQWVTDQRVLYARTTARGDRPGRRPGSPTGTGSFVRQHRTLCCATSLSGGSIGVTPSGIYRRRHLRRCDDLRMRGGPP